MGILSDYLDEQGAKALPPTEAETPGQFGKGLRAGLYSVGASGTSFAGNVAEVIAPEYAKGIYDTSRSLQAEANKHAPRVGQFKDVNSIRDFVDYSTGLIGGSLPHTAAALGGALVGRTPIGRALGATLATTPLEAGELVQRQQDDATIMQQDAATRLRDVSLGGAASAGVQSIVPAAVAGKIAAVGTKAAAPTLRSIPGTVAGNIAMEGATEAAGEVVKQGTLMQANEARGWDTDAMREAAIGGAIGGAPLAAMGGVADAAKVASMTPTNVLSGGKDLLDKGIDALGIAKDKAGAALDTAKSKVTNEDGSIDLDTPISSFAKAATDGTAKAKQWWKDVADGKDGAGFGDTSGMSAEDILAKMPGMDAERAATVTKTAKDLMEKVDVPQPLKDAVSKVTDFADKAQQAVVAKAKQAYDESIRFKDRAKAFAEGKGDVVDVESREVPDGTKKSKDYSGLRKVIADSMIPILKQHRPEVLADNASINAAAEGMRKMINRATIPDSTFELEDIEQLEGLFGMDGANAMLEATFKAMALNDTAKFEAFTGAMGDMMDAQDSHKAFAEVITKNLKSDAGLSDNDVSELAWSLERWARDSKLGTRVKGASDKAVSKAAVLRDKKIMRELRVLTGDKAESVMEALTKRAKVEEKNRVDQGSAEKNEDGEVVYEPGDALEADPRSAKTLVERMKAPRYEVHTFEHQKNGLVEWSDDDKGQAKQALARAKETYPDKNVEFLTADKLGDHKLVRDKLSELMFAAQDANPDLSVEEAQAQAEKELKKYGMVVAEGDRAEGAISNGDLRAIRIDKAAGDSYKHAGRMTIKSKSGPAVIDTIKLTRMMNERMESYPTDDISKSHRLGRAFMEGLGSLMDKYGEVVEPTNETPIAILGKNADGSTIYLTYGQAKNLDYRTDAQREDDDMRGWVRAEHKKYITARDAGDTKKAKAIWKDIQEALNDMEFKKARELVSGAEETGQRVIKGTAKRDKNGEIVRNKDTGGVVRESTYDSKGQWTGYVGTTTARKKAMASAYFTEDGNITDAGMKALMDGYDDAGIDTTIKRRKDHEGDTQFEGSGVTKRYLKGGKSPTAQRIKDLKVGNQPATDPDRRGNPELYALEEAERPKGNSSPVAGATEVDPFGNIHFALRNSEKGGFVNINSDGAVRGKQEYASDKSNKTPLPTTSPQDYPLMREKFENILQTGKPMQQAMAKRALWVIENAHTMAPGTLKKLSGIAGTPGKAEPQRTLASMMAVIDPIYDNYAPKVENKRAPSRADSTPTAPEVVAARKVDTAKIDARVDDMMVRDSYDTLTTDAKSVAFLRAAYRRYQDLKVKYDADTDMSDGELSAFNRMANAFSPGSREDLTSFFPNFPNAPMTDSEIRAMLKAGPGVSAKGPKAESRSGPQRASMQSINPAKTASANSEAAVGKYVDTVLGPAVKVEFVKLSVMNHAGEFTVQKGQAIIRISTHALSPMTVGFHESIHAFVHLLAKQGNGKIGALLMEQVMTPHVQSQLKTLLATEPDALKQLSDPEEAAAYMYQFYARGKLTLTAPIVKGWFNSLTTLIQKTLGIWSKEKRAQEILEYFQRGHFKANINDPNAVHKALMQSGTHPGVEMAKKAFTPLTYLGDVLLTPAATRMRDSGVPALRQLADLSKRQLVQDGTDPGYIPAARYRYTRYMNRLATKLQGYNEAELKEALEAMQDASKKPGASARALEVVDFIQNPQTGVLSGMLNYMRRSGVNVDKRVQARPDYFPRVYDTDYISRNQKAFVAVLDKYNIPDGMGLVRRLIANDGQEFTMETGRPGNQHTKERKLAVIPDAELAQFMLKDPYKILSGYIMQSTRQAEWAKRFGHNGEVLTNLFEDAKRQGATKQELAMADDYIKAVNGTLGDTLNPAARRMMGNVVVYQNVRLLPLAIFSNLVDPVGIMVRGGTLTDAFGAWKRGMKEIGNSFRKTYAADAEVKLAEAIGTIDNAVLAHEMSSLYTQGMVGDHAKKVNDIFFRYNMTEGMQRGMRVAATQAAIKFLERHGDGTASVHSIRWLAEVGLQPGDVTGPIDANASVKVKAAINRWVDGAVLRPDAADRALWMSDPHYMLFSHLKQFAFAFQETILKRVVHEAKAGNYQPVMALASYVPFMIAADAVKHMLQGGGELPEWKKAWGMGDYIGAGIERAGLLGARQFGVDAIQDISRGEVWMGSLTGPAIDQAFEGLSVIGGRVDGKTWLLDALPANDVYSSALKG